MINRNLSTLRLTNSLFNVGCALVVQTGGLGYLHMRYDEVDVYALNICKLLVDKSISVGIVSKDLDCIFCHLPILTMISM